MAFIKIDVENIKEYVNKELNLEGMREKAKALKKGFDWNPFDKDNDEYKTAWSEIQNNIRLCKEFLTEIVVTVEQASYVLGILEGGAKLEAAVDYLDSVVRLPLILEWFDKPLFRWLISLAVEWINDKHGHEWRSAGLIKR